MQKEYNPFEKTALNRASISVPTRNLINNNLLYGKILDYGCGYGYDYLYLLNLGLDISGYDKYNVVFNHNYLLGVHYDVVYANYVFNTIPTLREHKDVVNQLRSVGDNVYITLRNDTRAIKDNWEYIKEDDVYWNGRSYQRYYTELSINHYFGKVEYLYNNSSYIQLKLL